MIAKWKQHCPYDYEEKPVHRQAWREGWFYRKDHRPVAKEFERKMAERLPHSPWLQGYSAADEHLQEASPDARQWSQRPVPGEKHHSETTKRPLRRN
ncbi:MAG: hypothetical protein BRD31_04225 [Bacteroidetes bacterium QH_2_64_26]|nr:MAG: hypothetical protein BRD31_04225 [Bacteroidetes bacterium QH_2_64_26]